MILLVYTQRIHLFITELRGRVLDRMEEWGTKNGKVAE